MQLSFVQPPLLTPPAPATLPVSSPTCCSAATNPWADKACSAWLPNGNCGGVSDTYLDSCCANKRPGSRGCPGPVTPTGTTCGSTGPNNVDGCCSNLADPSVDPSCRAWTNSGSCSDVQPQYTSACW